MRPALIGLFAAALLAPSSAAPQSGAKKESAFGFTKGMTLKQVKAVASVQQMPQILWTYATTTPPAPVAWFSGYILTISPRVGLCRVMANTDDLKADSPQAKSAVSGIRQALVAKYGPSTVGKVPDEETMLEMWVNPFGPGTGIKLSAFSSPSGTVSYAVNYYFGNYEECQAEQMQGL